MRLENLHTVHVQHIASPIPISLFRFHQLQLSSDGRISELHGELKMKQLDCERTHMLHEETLRDLRQCELEREKLKKKVQCIHSHW